MRLYFFIYFIFLFVFSYGQIASYCDYESGSTTNSSNTNYYHYTTGNDQEVCNGRMLLSLKVLNANYAPAGIQFVLHPDYPNMLHATIPGFDGFYENATGGSSAGPSAEDIKEKYNIPKALNIYIVDFVYKRDGTSGISTYPKDIYKNLPGVFIKHGFSPGDIDARTEAYYDKTLMHEIGHYFGLLHINGIWYLKEGNTPRDLRDLDDCNENGDTICDTPAEPGMSNGAWDTNSSYRECIYHGYGGDYNAQDSTLQIGGYKQTYFSGIYPFYDYCEKWEVEDQYATKYFVMAFDTTDSPIQPGCGNLFEFELNGEATGLSEITVFTVLNSKNKLLAFDYYDEHDITDGCDLPDTTLHITENGDVLFNSSNSISHIQFNIDGGASITNVSDGKAKDNNFHFQFNHCRQFTNYDNNGHFFGTLGLNSDECNNDDDKSEYAAECHIENYPDLPIGHNFMRAGTFPYNSCGLSPINDNNYYDETKSGFTEEQYDNIRYFVEHCYTGCMDNTACNFDTTSSHLLDIGLIGVCKYPEDCQDDCENCQDDCLQFSDQMSRSEGSDSITLSNLNSLSDIDLDCATDKLYGDFTGEVWDNLINIRKKVKQMINNDINRTTLETIYIPIVFHNLYKIDPLSLDPILSPITFGINQIYPNPFNPITTIRYSLSYNTDVQISIYDITGRLITTLFNEFQIAGYHSITWNASNFSSSIYLLSISSGKFTETQKLVLIK